MATLVPLPAGAAFNADGDLVLPADLATNVLELFYNSDFVLSTALAVGGGSAAGGSDPTKADLASDGKLRVSQLPDAGFGLAKDAQGRYTVPDGALVAMQTFADTRLNTDTHQVQPQTGWTTLYYTYSEQDLRGGSFKSTIGLMYAEFFADATKDFLSDWFLNGSGQPDYSRYSVVPKKLTTGDTVALIVSVLNADVANLRIVPLPGTGSGGGTGIPGVPRDFLAVGDNSAITNAVMAATWVDGDLTAYATPADQQAAAPPAEAGQNASILVGSADVATMDEFDMRDSSGSAWRYRYSRRNDGTSGWTRIPKG